MPETPSSPPSGPSGDVPEKDSAFGWRRAAELVKNILRLERSVSRLEEENRELRKRVEELQRSVDDHNGQLKALLASMNTTIRNSVETSAERIAIETVLRFLETKK
ncbi:hypothetical protein [Hoeflea olei]|uniref:hypothetical protein n=1 Tax=Hoeflea olei TaxID=1480615 RepID=UPI0011120B23|nr:hypothetical protein [Hoeflea olei]